MSFGSSFKRIFSKVGSQLRRTVSSSGVLLSLGTGSSRRFFSRLGKDVTDEIGRVRKRISRQVKRPVSTRSVERSARRFAESEIAERALTVLVAPNLFGSAFTFARKQDQFRKAGLSGSAAFKLAALDFGREVVSGVATAGLPALVPGGLGGGVRAGAGAGTAGTSTALGGGGGASVSLFGDLLGGFSGIAKEVGGQLLKAGVQRGTQVLTERLTQSIGGGGRSRQSKFPPMITDQSGFMPPPAGILRGGGGSGRGATASFPKAGRSSAVSRNGLTYSTVPFDARRLPASAFRDLPGGVKAGFIPGGQQYKPFQLETGEVVLREKKTRRMNPLNIKAATRAMRRIESLGRVIKRVRKITKKVKAI